MRYGAPSGQHDDTVMALAIAWTAVSSQNRAVYPVSDSNLIVKGTVSAVGTGTIDVLVTGGNHRGRALKGQTVTFDVSNARIVVADVNGDGSRDLADVAVGDRVVVHSRVDKGATVDPSQPLVAKRVVDQGAASTGGSGDTTDTGSGDTTDTGGDSGSTPTP